MRAIRRFGWWRLVPAIAATALAVLVPTIAVGDPGPTSGAFVIGDQDAAMGAQVTFWGAQWWKDNTLSGGDAPASFKGFADTATATTASCGQSWTTLPGNSSAPPASVDGVIPVVVASEITKSGEVISGNTTEVVLVQTDPGYQGDPGHPGTGTVIGVLCGGAGGSGPPG